MISGNPAIVEINRQMAPEFSATTSYKKGEMVMHEGKFYVFKVDHPAGAWNENHVVSSDLATQIELLPDQIISYVGQMGYSRTYIQPTDPALDPDKEVLVGDYWIKTNNDSSNWGGLRSSTWQSLRTKAWRDIFIGDHIIYCRTNDNKWLQVYDASIMAEAFTRITQNQFEIKQEAYRANAAEGVLRSSISQTADMIRQEVTRATAAEDSKIDKTLQYQTADAIVTEAVSQALNADNRTFVQDTDPALDEANQVREGDIWIDTSMSGSNWGDIKNKNWNDLRSYKWAELLMSGVKSYARSADDEWIELDNNDAVAEAYTRITQTSEAIKQEAVRAQLAEGTKIAKTETYQTADMIVNSAISIVDPNSANVKTFSTGASYSIGDRVIYNGNMYEFTSAHSGSWNPGHVRQIHAGDTYIAKTNQYQTAEEIYSEAVMGSLASVAPVFVSTKDYSIGDRVSYQGKIYEFTQDHTAGAWNINHVKTIITDTLYINKTSVLQTADAILSSAIKIVDPNSDDVETFDSKKAYARGDRVIYGTDMYEFTANHTGAWDPNHVNLIHAGDTYIAKTNTYQDAASIRNDAVKGSLQSIADEFSPSQSYAVGDRVMYNYQIWEFTQAHPAGAWNSSHAKTVQTDTLYINKTTTLQTADAIMNSAIKIVDPNSSTLETFNPTKSYQKGMRVTYQNNMYEFTQNHSGDWNSAHVKQVHAGDTYISKTQTLQTADEIVNTATKQALSTVAPEFSATTQYHQGDRVNYNGKLYEFLVDHYGAWNINHVKEIMTNDLYIAQTQTLQTADAIVNTATKKALSTVAPEFSSTTSYQKGDRVNYDGKLYEFTSPHSGPWNSNHVKEVGTNDLYIGQTSTMQTADEIVSTATKQSLSSISPAFDQTHSYSAGDKVNYDGSLWEFTTSHTGAWNSSHVKQIGTSDLYINQTQTYQTADQIASKATKDSLQYIAPAFTDTRSYAIGDRVSYDGKLWEFTHSHSAGAWNSSHVREIAVSDFYINQTSRMHTADEIRDEAIKGSLASMVTPFSSSTAYAEGDHASYEGKIYKFTSAHQGNWTGNDVTEVKSEELYIGRTSRYSTADSIRDEAVKTSSQNMIGIEEFSTTGVYDIGDRVFYENNLYEFTDIHYGQWNPNHVTEIKITSDYIKRAAVTLDNNGHIQISSLSFDSTGLVGSGITVTPTSISIASTGTFSLSSTYFSVATDGEITSTKGTIGGWTIADGKISAGTNSNYVHMSSDATVSKYAFIAGGNPDNPTAQTDSEAPFRVTRDGKVYLKKLMILDDVTQEWVEADMTSNSQQDDKVGTWKLKYNTIKSVDSSTGVVTMSNGTTFNSAASVRIGYGTWSGETTTARAQYTAQCLNGSTVVDSSAITYLTSNWSGMDLEVHGRWNNVPLADIVLIRLTLGTSVGSFGSDHKATCTITSHNTIYGDSHALDWTVTTFSVDASSQWRDGYTTGAQTVSIVNNGDSSSTADLTLTPGQKKELNLQYYPPTSSQPTSLEKPYIVSAASASINSVSAGAIGPSDIQDNFTVTASGTNVSNRTQKYYIVFNDTYVEIHQGSKTGTIVARRYL